ncbi:queuosine precursor transporter [Oceanidesulfovibrio marinus]|uniref:Probable queuosine precursor transporter n=1 Tax=Oceanidesulfovibrio marinus TaxID=370038 RepID=A0A6P1ZI69_9BACT|nr:queuosine precursor transporter [Oceanidesulfovibrio marinus]QJT08136.1 VUT family protein [Oceanidesulfovibrio marinus]TVM35032.1 VUT family protein [Oceanidesulfovibrio marinus]
MNETLWLGFALLDLTLVVFIYRFFGKAGMFALVVFNLVLCNIQVLKVIDIFGMTTTLGNVLYASVFLATDILSEHHGKEEARRAVLLGFLALLMATVYMQIALLFTPNADDFVQPHLQAIFSFMPRVAAASMVAYLVSQLHDVWAFHKIRARTGVKHLWLRNNLSTLASQFLDSAIFTLAAFWGVFPANVVWEIFFTTFLMKAFVACLDTPFIYVAGWVRPTAAAQS